MCIAKLRWEIIRIFASLIRGMSPFSQFVRTFRVRFRFCRIVVRVSVSLRLFERERAPS